MHKATFSAAICIAALLVSCSFLSCVSKPSAAAAKPAPEPKVISVNGERVETPAQSSSSVKPCTITGVLTAYGSEPHVVWMIKTASGELFYPAGDLQSLLSKVPSGTYEWTGELDEAKPALPGLIPKNAGTFTTLSWKRIGD